MAKQRTKTKASLETLTKIWEVFQSLENPEHRATFFKWLLDLRKRGVVDNRVLEWYGFADWQVTK